jgi:subtilisin family serine protease
MFLIFQELKSELVVIEGKELGNGFYRPGKVFEIDKNRKYLKNKLYIKTKENFDLKMVLLSLNTAVDIDISYPFVKYIKNDHLLNSNDLNRIASVKFNNDIDIFDLCKNLNKDNRIEYAVPEYINDLRFIPNDTQYEDQYYLHLIEAEAAWEIQKGSEEILIAIVDSGIDVLHEDLSDNIWENPNEIADNGIDDDNNGFIDDVRGWDFIGDISQQEAYQSKWKEDNNVTPKYSSNWHGTHVAGIAGASTNNAKGIAGASFNCKILPVKVSTDNIDPGNGGVNATLRGYEGILYAAQMGADIINVSWGTYGYNPLEEDILNHALSYGPLILAAVGNDQMYLESGSGDYPAMYPGVTAVGATNTNGRKSNYSNYIKQK